MGAETKDLLVLTNDQIELVKRTVARGATNDEFALFLYTARRTGLDPLSRQIHFIKRNQFNPKTERYEEVGSIQTGIDGFRVVAQRSEAYAGQVGPFWCGEDGVWKDVWVKAEPPVAAKVGVLASNFKEPLFAVAKYTGYVQLKKDGTPTKMWAKMPELMLAKCAEALALRKAFPQDLSGLYTTDEMGQADSATPGKEPPQKVDAEIVDKETGEVKTPGAEEGEGQGEGAGANEGMSEPEKEYARLMQLAEARLGASQLKTLKSALDNKPGVKENLLHKLDFLRGLSKEKGW